MKRYILLSITILVIALAGCNDDYFHDTGLADGKHNCSMWEYMKSDHENWDSTVLLIERAGLQSLFDGTDSDNKEITFFGPTNMSIMQFLFKTVNDDYEMIYNSIKDIPVELCKQLVLSHVIKGKKTSTGFGYENKGTLTGGTELENLLGNPLRIYRTKSEYYDIPDIGPEALYIHSLTFGQIALIASSNIETTNGIVHSLATTYEISEL